MKTKLILSLLIGVLTIMSCNDDDDMINPDCENCVIINRSLYDQSRKEYTILSAEIVNDCLEMMISSSGCDGERWVATLYDSGDIAESFPAQRSLRLDLENDEECDAVITKSYKFDITPLQTEEPKFILNIDGFDEALLYEYDN